MYYFRGDSLNIEYLFIFYFMKRLFVQAYVNDNLGDDLFLHILFERYKNVQFRLMTNGACHQFRQYPNVELSKQPSSNLMLRILSKALRMLSMFGGSMQLWKLAWRKYLVRQSRECDAYLYIGGSIFMQHSKGFRFTDLLNGWIAEIFKDKFILGANFGPYQEDAYLSFYQRKVFPSYLDICFRDQYSYSLFSNMSNVRYCQDIVFQLRKNHRSNVLKKSIGFSIMDFSHREDIDKKLNNLYVQKVLEAIEWHYKLGYDIYLFSFCKHEGDEKAIESILSSLPSDVKCFTCSYGGDIDAFLSIYSSMETMVTLRFHSLILSVLYGQKIYPLIYSNKTLNVLRDGLQYSGPYKLLKDLNSWNPCQLLQEAMVVDYKREEFALSAERQFMQLDKFLNT